MTQQVSPGLAFDIDSSSARKSTDDLDAMSRRAGVAQAAVQLLARSAADSGTSFASFSAHLGESAGRLTAFSNSMEGLVSTLQNARSALDGTAASFEGFERARQRVEALSGALGTSAVTLEAFSRQASVFNMTSYETSTALQRITMAIEGQTAAGRELRALMQDYGVTLSGITSSQADQVLTRFVSQVRTMATSPQNTRAIESVLGPLDPQALASVQNPDLETVNAREARLRVQAVDRQVIQRTNDASQVMARAQRDTAELRDFEGGVFFGGAYDLSALSRDQMQQVQQGLGHRISMANPHDRLDAYRYINTAAPDDIRTAARQPPSWVHPIDRIGYDLEGTWADRWTKQWGNGDWLSRQAKIDAAGAAQQFDDHGNLGPGGARGLLEGMGDHDTTNVASRFLRTAPVVWTKNTLANALGIDTTNGLLQGDTRPQAPYVTFEKRQTTAQGLAELGFTEPESRIAAEGRIRLMQTGASEKTPPDALGTLTKAYQDDMGLSRGDALAEAQSRYNNALDRLDVAHDTAMVPGGQAVSDARTQRWIMQLPPEQRAQARALLAYGDQQGVSTSRWADRGISLDSLLTSGASGAGYFSPTQLRGFGQVQEADQGNQIASSNDALKQQLQLQQNLTDAVPLGAAAVERSTAYWNAYNAALAQRGPSVARVEATNAETAAVARNNTEMEKTLDLMDRHAKAGERTTAAVDAAGTDPSARTAAGYRSAIDNDVIAQRAQYGANFNADAEARYRNARARGLATEATSFGQQQVTGSEEELNRQKQIVDAASSRIDIQQRLNREIEIEKNFADAIAKARLAPDPDQAIADLRRVMSTLGDLGTQIDDVKRRGADIQFSRDTERSAGLQDAVNGMSPDERRQWAALQPWLDQHRTDPEFAKLSPPQLADLLIRHPDNIQTATSRDSVTAVTHQRTSSEGAAATESREQSDVAIRRSNAAAGAAGGGAYRAAIAAAGVPGTGPNRDQEARQAVAQREADFAAQRASDAAALNQEISDNQRLAQALQQGTGAYQAMRVAIEAEHSARDKGASSLEQETIKRGEALKTITGQTKAIADQVNSFGDRTNLDQRRADAYRTGGQMGGEAFDRRAQYDQQSQNYDALLQRDPDNPQTLDAVAQGRAVIAAAGLAADQSAYAKSAADFRAQQSKTAMENQITQANISAGPFASPRDIEHAQNAVRADQISASTNGAVSQPDALKDLDLNSRLKEQLQTVQQLRDGFAAMGQSAAKAFEDAAVSGGKTRTIVHALGRDIERDLLRTFIEQPVLKGINNAMSSGLSSLFGGSSSGGSPGGGSGGVGGALGGAASSWGLSKFFDSITPSWAAINPLNWFASGGIIDHGTPTRYLAGGGLIDRPTTIYAAGGTVMAGEADTEAVMPLKRLPNGNLGIQSAGGGGHTFIVQAPVTIQGNAVNSAGAPISAAAMKQMQAQMEKAHTMAIRSALANEMRDGGDLSSAIGAYR